MVKLKDIATELGISCGVVSRALNPDPAQHNLVSQTTRQRVIDCAVQMGYKPHLAAAALRRGQVQTIGVFLPVIRNSLMIDLLHGISDAATEEGLPLSLHFSLHADEYADFFNRVVGTHPLGMISYCPYDTPNRTYLVNALQEYSSRGGKAVFVHGEPEENTQFSSVLIDNYYGGKLAAEFLKKYPTQSFLGVFSSFHPHRCERRRGFSDSMRNEDRPTRIIQDDFDNALRLDTAYRRLEPLLHVQSRPAIFVDSDMLGMYIISRLLADGILPGRDVTILGYDNIYANNLQHPRLTTIAQPFYELGSMAAKQLFRELRGEKPERILLKPVLIPGETA